MSVFNFYPSLIGADKPPGRPPKSASQNEPAAPPRPQAIDTRCTSANISNTKPLHVHNQFFVVFTREVYIVCILSVQLLC